MAFQVTTSELPTKTDNEINQIASNSQVANLQAQAPEHFRTILGTCSCSTRIMEGVKGGGGDVTSVTRRRPWGADASLRRRQFPYHTSLVHSSTLSSLPPLTSSKRPCTPANTTISSNSSSSAIQASERYALPPLATIASVAFINKTR